MWQSIGFTGHWQPLGKAHARVARPVCNEVIYPGMMVI